MAVSAQAAANEFIRIARDENRPLTNMQLQKHVFLAHGYCLALVDRELYFNNTHAWQWGPVVPKLYKALQQYGSGQVTADIPAEDSMDQDSREYTVLRAVWNAYRKYSAAQLSEMTHREGSPWSKTWATNRFGVIPNDEIQAYYKEIVAARK